MGRQLNLRQHYVFLLDPVYAPSGDVIAWELLTRFTQGNEAAANSGHALFDCLLEAEKWQLFQLQLEHISTLYQSGFSQILSLNVDSDIIHGILKSDAVQQQLDQLPGLRLEISALFTERYHARDRLLLQKLAGMTPGLLWLDDFGAGGSTLSMLNSGIFEYVKTDKNFFWKYGEGYAFDTLLNHVNDLCNGVIVQGIDTQQHYELMANRKVAGLQGCRWKALDLVDLNKKLIKNLPSKSLRKERPAIINYRNFL